MTANNQINRIKIDNKQRLYGSATPIVGLTGGIGTGKSTISQMLMEKGHGVINADLLVKNIYLEEESINFIKSIVPEAIEKHVINFVKLRTRVFNDPIIKEQIENFIYQKLPLAFKKEASLLKEKNFLIYDVPLLFEKKLQDKFDLTVLIYAPKEIQLMRASKRDKAGQESIQKIIDAQLPIDDKKRIAHYVLDNSGTITEARNEVEKLCHFLKMHFSPS